MALSNPVQAPLTNIVRSTPDQRIAEFTKNQSSIYNKFSPYDGSTGGIGFSQPFVYTKLTDSNFSKNLTKYDNQAFPIGSTARDLQRVGKFMLSGQGLLYVGKQFLLQNQNPFNETRIYNPLSVLGATAKPATLGIMNRPTRFINAGNGALGTFFNALKGSVGIDQSEPVIQGTAGWNNGDDIQYNPISNYAAARGSAKFGLVRYDTATAATRRFSETWVANSAPAGGGGFLANLGQTLKNTLAKAIPSTNPMGIFGGKPTTSWKYRPEYSSDTAGVYYAFLDDRENSLLSVKPVASSLFYNDRKASVSVGEIKVTQFHRYTPPKEGQNYQTTWYAPTAKLTDEAATLGKKTDFYGNVDDDGQYYTNLKSVYDRMVESIGPYSGQLNQRKGSAERYTESPKKYPDLKDIRAAAKGDEPTFQQAMVSKFISWNANSFAGASGSNQHDEYNALKPIKGKRGEIPTEIRKKEINQSKDVIFFYFFDLINEVYLPFRATLTGVSDQHSADWEDITYMGRADKLFVYKGFSRDVNLSFTVYANSIKELVPMWERLNYLVGLVRPSGYTGKAYITNQATTSTTGRESQFIYPPMVTMRVGDMYHDQPCVISSISMTIPEDTNWETLRSDERYDYASNPVKQIRVDGVSSRQLPLKVDVSMTLKLMEKEQSVTWGNHFGHNANLDEKMPPKPEPPKVEPQRPIVAPQLSLQNMTREEQEDYAADIALGSETYNTLSPTFRPGGP